METTKNLKAIYSKRMMLLETRWNELMSEKKQMTFEEVSNESFQDRKNRIGALYSRMNKIINQPKSDAIKSMLQHVGSNHMANLPQGKITVNFNNL